MKYKYPIKTIPDEEHRWLSRSNCNNRIHLNVFCWYKKYSSISKVYEHVIQVSRQILNHLSVIIIDKALALLVYTQAGLFYKRQYTCETICPIIVIKASAILFADHPHVYSFNFPTFNFVNKDPSCS